MHGFRGQPLPWGKRTLGRHRMSKSPCEPQNDEYQNDDSKGDMKCHSGAGLHAPMNIRHQPAAWILHEQKLHDEPVEPLRGGPVLQTIDHEVLSWQDFSSSPNRNASVTRETGGVSLGLSEARGGARHRIDRS